MHHVEVVLKILHDQSLFAKLSKYDFDLTKILYLGHIIGQDGMKVHLEKIKFLIEWSCPKNFTKLGGLIWICTYYAKFVKGFSQLTSTLTDLTNKDDFQWNKGDEKTFQIMKM